MTSTSASLTNVPAESIEIATIELAPERKPNPQAIPSELSIGINVDGSKDEGADSN